MPVAGFGVSDGTLAIYDLIRQNGGDGKYEGFFLRGVQCNYRPSARAIAETLGGFGISYVEVLWHVHHLDTPKRGWASCFGTARQHITRGYEVEAAEALAKLDDA